ncbi:Fructose-bisphosphate aldolase [Heracleum sosnowskyi]|uniref:fructose-bisphosphate aldolase n=1 Tax=Heracleum sosnowskyi TaxID=360622 RepID=A0AAD8JE21_9APIA|nr:Fructose-bisphosphate aldolase [Heracleum sosnowskyi]
MKILMLKKSEYSTWKASIPKGNEPEVGYTCSSKAKKGNLKGQDVAVKVIPKSKKTIASPGCGILAIDESNATCGKRLASIGLDNTEVNKQAYRQLLLTTPGLGEYISGAIMFEETLHQSTTDGKKMVDCLIEQSIVPGIKVDEVPTMNHGAKGWMDWLLDQLNTTIKVPALQSGAQLLAFLVARLHFVSIPYNGTLMDVHEKGIGIVKYFQGKGFLIITGATGFLAKGAFFTKQL